jgi:hypothetical protein
MHGAKRNANKVFIRNTGVRRPVGRQRHWWMNNIKMYH